MTPGRQGREGGGGTKAMGRHADTTRKRGIRVPIGVISIVLVLLCAVALGLWWWKLKSATDPIDADPVDAYGVVVTSPSCTAGGLTTVTVSGTSPPVTATLNACGYRVGEQLAIQYLAGHPELARIAGTSTAGSASLAARLLPIGILTAGLIAVLATISLLVERRRSRHQAAAADRGTRRGATAPAGGGAVVADQAGRGPDGRPQADRSGDGSVADGGGHHHGGPLDARPASDDGEPASGSQTAPGGGEVFPDNAYGTGYGTDGPRSSAVGEISAPVFGAAATTPEDVEALENAVVVDQGMLFTHTHPEPPEPAGAPVELSGDDQNGA